MAKRIITLMAAFVTMVSSLPVAADAGGIPGMVAALQAAVATLTTQVTVLQTTNSSLQNALNAEIQARIAADTALQNALNTEMQARIAANTALQNLINTDAAASVAADATLQAEITALQNKPAATPTLWALINANDGTLVRGQGVVSVQPIPTGIGTFFEVKFNQDVSNCAYGATGVDLVDGAFPVFVEPVGVGPSATDNTKVSALVLTHLGASRVTASLAVFCK